MSASWIFNTIVGGILLPPINGLLLCLLGLVLARKRPRIGIALGLSGVVLLTALSTGLVARQLAQPLESQNPPLSAASRLDVQAIVILGGGRLQSAPEYGHRDVPSLVTQARLRYGAALQRRSGLPVLVSGGAPDGRQVSEAALMAQLLREDLQVPVRWIEQGSDDTAGNARLSAHMLQAAGIHRIALVTDALHMPRARRAFEVAGLQVLPAPTVFAGHSWSALWYWLPNAKALQVSYYALHEWLGLAWYRLRH